MNLTQKQRKIVLSVAAGLVVAIIIAGVIGVLVILLGGDDYCDNPSSVPTLLYVSENDDNVTIQWSRTIFTCSGSYLLKYSINGGQQIEVSTTDIQHTVIKPPVCSHMLIQLQTVGESGKISEESFDRDYTVLPSNAYVTNTSVTRTVAGIVASWEKPIGLETCDISYSVRFISELGQFNNQTDSRTIIVPDDIFCLIVRVQVSSIVGFSETWYGHVGYAYAKNIVANVSIPSENPYVLIATWSHDNEDICSLSYQVTYRFGLESKTYLVVQPRVIVDVQYCEYATLTILPSALDGEYTGWSSLIGVTQEPDDIEFEPVQNVRFALNELSMAVSWDIPDALSLCEDLYNVTAKNSDLNEEANCQGTNGCEVTLSSYCPSTDFIITPIRLQGETVSEQYSCT